MDNKIILKWDNGHKEHKPLLTSYLSNIQFESQPRTNCNSYEIILDGDCPTPEEWESLKNCIKKLNEQVEWTS